jgi:hypothetical protein
VREERGEVEGKNKAVFECIRGKKDDIGQQSVEL